MLYIFFVTSHTFHLLVTTYEMIFLLKEISIIDMDYDIVYFNFDTQRLYYITLSIEDHSRDFCFDIDFDII